MKSKLLRLANVGFAMLFALILVSADALAQAPTYEMERIPLPDGSTDVRFDEVNNLGLVTGRSNGSTFVYDSLGIIANQTPGTLYWIHDLVDIPGTWNGFSIRGRNDNGYEIVGWVDDSTGELSAAYIDLSRATATTKAPLVLLGTNIDSYVADDINDDGDIIIRGSTPNGNEDLFYVHRDNPAQAIALGIDNIGGTPKIGNRLYDETGLVRNAIISAQDLNPEPSKLFRYTLGDPLGNIEYIDDQIAPDHLSARDMNDDGVLCGVATVTTSVGKGNKTKTTNPIGVFADDLLTLNSGEGGHGDGINNFGDCVGDNFNSALVFFGHPNSGYDSYLIEDLLEDGPEKDFVYGLSQRAHSINDLGQITFKGNGRFYLLNPISQPPGGETKTYSSGNINLDIPDNDPGGASHTIGVGSGDAVQIIGLTVTLNISHPRPSDLTVTMMGPDGTEVTLTNFSGDNNVTAFNGTSSQGLWTLKAVDSRKKREGTINSWSINADY